MIRRRCQIVGLPQVERLSTFNPFDIGVLGGSALSLSELDGIIHIGKHPKEPLPYSVESGCSTQAGGFDNETMRPALLKNTLKFSVPCVFMRT